MRPTTRFLFIDVFHKDLVIVVLLRKIVRGRFVTALAQGLVFSSAEICKAVRLLTMQREGLAALCLGNTRTPCLLVRGHVQGSASFDQLGLALQCET